MSTPKTITLYGIVNCDTVKKARAWLAAQGVTYVFHDFKKSGVSAEQLVRWSQAVGWQALLNRRGTTWRGLDAAAQVGAQDEASACALMQEHTSLIKRPVVEWEAGSVSVGFDTADWTKRIAPSAARPRHGA
ncbi:MAG: arsenate reductase [Comamonas sp. SCN 65-56]|uniref:ArsC family reductase n=1 Tax=Comamonas sp. SCN 65-56 TaxID=1660095 RepID=UPI00086A0B82|nr:ArsC family reductase [Comamonas sp. SCN 65-56]ODS91904.1 MAG: arsenate reductase [Comamonas sp. SCN 65-56]